MEFVQMMKDWRRMCAKMGEKDEYTACDRCRLQDYGCPAIYETGEETDWAHVESVVAKWAEENPEPQYPTWEEWLVANGVMESDIVRLNGDYRFYYNGKPVKNIPSPKMFDPIPADIAEKLGIEPKEG